MVCDLEHAHLTVLQNSNVPFITKLHSMRVSLCSLSGGDCYGRVLPCHVDALIDRHILGGEVLQSLWRGRVGDASLGGGQQVPSRTNLLSW
jgi:hypothetical protein